MDIVHSIREPARGGDNVGRLMIARRESAPEQVRIHLLSGESSAYQTFEKLVAELSVQPDYQVQGLGLLKEALWTPLIGDCETTNQARFEV